MLIYRYGKVDGKCRIDYPYIAWKVKWYFILQYWRWYTSFFNNNEQADNIKNVPVPVVEFKVEEFVSWLKDAHKDCWKNILIKYTLAICNDCVGDGKYRDSLIQKSGKSYKLNKSFKYKHYKYHHKKFRNWIDDLYVIFSLKPY